MTWKKLPSQELLGSRAAPEVGQPTGRRDAVRPLGELYKALTAFDASPLRTEGWGKGFLGTVSPSGVRHLLCFETSSQMSRTITLEEHLYSMHEGPRLGLSTINKCE